VSDWASEELPRQWEVAPVRASRVIASEYSCRDLNSDKHRLLEENFAVNCDYPGEPILHPDAVDTNNAINVWNQAVFCAISALGPSEWRWKATRVMFLQRLLCR
jgi:hypothetical protein